MSIWMMDSFIPDMYNNNLTISNHPNWNLCESLVQLKLNLVCKVFQPMYGNVNEIWNLYSRPQQEHNYQAAHCNLGWLQGEVKDKGRIQVEHLVFAFWLILPISQGHPSISEDMSLPHFSLFCKCFAEVGHISFSVVPFSCENWNSHKRSIVNESCRNGKFLLHMGHMHGFCNIWTRSDQQEKGQSRNLCQCQYKSTIVYETRWRGKGGSW